jgi:hypothetical protein
MTTMGPQPVSPAELDAMPLDTRMEVALLITTTGRDELTGTVLIRDDAGIYHRTDRPLVVRWPAGTPVYMGQPADVRADGAIQARGVLTEAGTLAADRLAILSGYVEVR